MSRHRTPSSRRRSAGPRARLAHAVVALVTGSLALSGCGVRLESPPPAEPSPDAVELVRGRAVADALGLADAAAALAAGGVADPVRVVLDDVVAFSTRHAEELGGVYDSGLPDATPSTPPSPTPSAVTDVGTLLAELVDDAARAADGADDVPEGALARLVASVAVARDGLADRLAAATGLPRPAPADAAAPDDVPDDAVPQDVAPQDAVPDDATPTADAQVTDRPATAAAPSGSDPTPGADAPVPPAPGAVALALAHDEAAWTLTVLAARTADAPRAALLTAAAGHRAESDAWARTVGIVGQPTDPRRSAYALPAGIDDPTVAQALPRLLEQAVADASAQAVADAPAGERSRAIASLRTATAAATAWGAAAVPFPGMPELGTAPVG